MFRRGGGITYYTRSFHAPAWLVEPDRQWHENVHLSDKEIHAFVLNQLPRWLDDVYPPALFLLTLNRVRNYFLLVLFYQICL
jgi:hypothetical protein